MDHLIELRSRLIKALLAFGLAFIFCFFFAKQIYNVLVWPFVWVAGPENSKFIYTALLEYFLTQVEARHVRRGLHFVSGGGRADLHVRGARPLQARARRVPAVSDRDADLLRARSLLVYFLVLPMLIRFSLGMQQTGGAEDGADRACCRRSANIFH